MTAFSPKILDEIISLCSTHGKGMFCTYCEAPASYICSICKSAHYCSKAHQEEDWQRHKWEHMVPDDQKSVLSTMDDYCQKSSVLVRVKHTGDPLRKFGVFMRQDVKAGTTLFSEATHATGRLSDIIRAYRQGRFNGVIQNMWSMDRDFNIPKNEIGFRDLIFRNNLADSHTVTQADPLVAIFFLFHRINHSCSPNAGFFYNAPERRVNVIAARDLKKGEEVTIYYYPMHFILKEIRDKLFKKRFEEFCKCHVCANEDENETDAVIETIIDSVISILVNKDKFHEYLDEEEEFTPYSIERIYRNMLHIVDLLYGLEEKTTVPFSPFRAHIYKNFLPFLNTYPAFMREKRHNRQMRQLFKKLKQEAIDYFTAYGNLEDAKTFEFIKIF